MAESAEYEMTFADKFDVVIVNDNLDMALADKSNLSSSTIELPIFPP